jgi:itaconate CoA-transferase
VRPLEGLLVVAIEQAVAAPFCTARLADGGARVIKVERAEGDFARDYDNVVNGGSAYFDWLNRGKESICLDLKRSEDANLLHRIIDGADVFIQNLAPGAAHRAGFGADALRKRNPRLITCEITGYGQGGPLESRKAYDLLIQCESGLASVTGTPEAPGRVGISVVDLTGGINAYTGILEALMQRERSGVGAELSVSLFDCIADWMAVPLLHYEYGGLAPKRVGIAHSSIVPYGAFRCSDGHAIVIAVQNDREWRTLVEKVLDEEGALAGERYVNNSARTAHRAEVEAAIARSFARRSSVEMIALLEDARIAFSSLNDVSGLARHPHLRRMSVLSPEGEVSLPAAPVRWHAREINPGPIPGLGEHSGPIRAEFATRAAGPHAGDIA